MTTTYTICESGEFRSNRVYQVWAEPEDEQGYCIEEMCEMLAFFKTEVEAKQYIKTL
jgi:hypothetical protein